MKSSRLAALLLAFSLCFLVLVHAAPRGRKEATKPSSKAPPPLKLNVDILPPLQDVLAELEMTPHLRDFVAMGVTETRLLLKLSAMDFQIMTMDWKDFPKEQVAKLKGKIAQLLQMATIAHVEERADLLARNKLTYGRIFLPNGVQAMEYSLASFGSPPPVGELKLTLSKSIIECEVAPGVDYGGHFVLAQRGNCTFLTKALVAKEHNAGGLILVNTEDRLDSPSSGLGVDRNITEAVVASLSQLTVAGMANTSWLPLLTALQTAPQHTLPIHIVPIKCHTGGHCLPMLDEERALQAEVTWGRLRVRTANKETRSFEFLTSNFGAPLPVDVELPLIWADPVDACSPLPVASGSGPMAIIAHRGHCQFDVKALNAQNAGARMLILVDVEDQALQRVGAMAPEVGYVGIPSMLVTAEAGHFLTDGAVAQVIPATDNKGFDNWLEVAYTQWVEDPKDRVLQLQGMLQKFQDTVNHDIVGWLQRRINEIEFPSRKSIDTDEL